MTEREKLYSLRRYLQAQVIREIVEAMQEAERKEGDYRKPKDIVERIIKQLDEAMFDF